MWIVGVRVPKPEENMLNRPLLNDLKELPNDALKIHENTEMHLVLSNSMHYVKHHKATVNIYIYTVFIIYVFICISINYIYINNYQNKLIQLPAKCSG